MKRDVYRRLLFIILFVSSLHMIGCSAARSVYEISANTAKSVSNKVKPGKKPLLRKRVLVSHVMDQAGVGKKKATQLTDTLVQGLEKDRHLLITRSTESIHSRKKIRSPQYGVVIDPDLAKKAEKMNMDVLVITVLHPFEVTLKKGGIWPLRRIIREVEISMAVNALDITNGTLFLSNLENRKVKLKGDVLEDQEDKWEIDDKILDKVLASIMKKQTSSIIDALKNQPWTGKIIVAGNETLMINGGKDVGITEGSVFEVFSQGELIASFSGKNISSLGSKLGEIKVGKVLDYNSLVIPLMGEGLEDGQVVRIKIKN